MLQDLALDPIIYSELYSIIFLVLHNMLLTDFHFLSSQNRKNQINRQIYSSTSPDEKSSMPLRKDMYINLHNPQLPCVRLKDPIPNKFQG